jgi:hypothetical protein
MHQMGPDIGCWAGEKLRCVGSALSPNGLAFSQEGMLSLALLDDVLQVDPASKQVRVQAGARVQEVVEALRPHGLTLQNYASIREQSIGGFTQACLPQLLMSIELGRNPTHPLFTDALHALQWFNRSRTPASKLTV